MTDKEFDRLITQACRARCSSVHNTEPSGMLVLRAFIRYHIRPILYWIGAAAVIISAIILPLGKHTDAQQYIPENENYANLIKNTESRIDRNKMTSGALREKIDLQIPFPTDYEN
ncbi:MAG: hypothetical protein K2G95_02840 [Muribaculaceae bacterium]|nr:hypothetical protein [Muribaculaceae bacterium]